MAKKKREEEPLKGTVQAVRVQKMSEAVRSMAPALRTIFKHIEERLEEIREKAVLLFYEIGEDVVKVEKNPDKYGEKGVVQLAVGLGFNSDPKKNPLGKARQFVSAYTRKEVKRLMNAAEDLGNEFTKTHFECLAPLTGEHGLAIRTLLESSVIQHGMPVRELRREIVLRVKGLPQEDKQAGGRKPIPPKDKVAACNELCKYSRDIKIRQANWDQALFLPLKEVKGQKDPDLANSKIDENLLLHLNKSREDYKELAETATRTIQQLSESINTVEDLLQTQADATRDPTSTRRTKPKTRPTSATEAE